MSGFNAGTESGSYGCCSCGEHHGVRNMDKGKKIEGIYETGDGWTHVDRAKAYAWFWDRNGKLFGGSAMTPERTQYLRSWVSKHGMCEPDSGFKFKTGNQLLIWAEANNG